MPSGSSLARRRREVTLRFGRARAKGEGRSRGSGTGRWSPGGHEVTGPWMCPQGRCRWLEGCWRAGQQVTRLHLFPPGTFPMLSLQDSDCSNSLHCPHKARAARPQTNRPHALSRRRERGVSVRQTVQLRRTFPLARPWFPAPRLRLRGVPAAPAPTPCPDSPRGSAAVIGL